MPLAGVVALDAVGLVLADVEPPQRDQLGVGLPAIGAVEPGLEAAHPLEQPLAGSVIATAAFPVHQPP